MSIIQPNCAVTDVCQSPNFDSRPGGPTAIVIHHWGVDGQSHQGVVDYLCRDRGDSSTSAHYVASAGRVTQIVSDRDRAWHCPGMNSSGIGIECRPEMSDADFETVASLVAAIRSEWGPLTLSGHQDHYATSCPGRWEARLGELSARADAIAAGVPAVSVSAPAEPAPAVDPRADGIIGPATITALQAHLGAPVDGAISSQYAPNQVYVPAAGEGWEWTDQPSGSQTVAALQARLGCEADGIIGPDTIRALQAHLGVGADGYLGEVTARALQTRLRAGSL